MSWYIFNSINIIRRKRERECVRGQARIINQSQQGKSSPKYTPQTRQTHSCTTCTYRSLIHLHADCCCCSCCCLIYLPQTKLIRSLSLSPVISCLHVPVQTTNPAHIYTNKCHVDSHAHTNCTYTFQRAASIYCI